MRYRLDVRWGDAENALVESFAAAQFSDWVRRLRRITGLQQTELAAKAGVSLDQVRRLEQGENVGLWYLAAIPSALAETPGRVGYESPSDRLNHHAFSLLLEDGAAVRASRVLTARRRKHTPVEKGRSRAVPL